MRKLTALDFKKFLWAYGYYWNGLVADRTGQQYEEFRKCNKLLSSLDNKYIIVERANILEEKDGFVDVREPQVKYVRCDLTSFNIYYIDNKGPNFLNLLRCLDEEWVKYLILHVEGYEKYVAKEYKDLKIGIENQIDRRNRLLSLQIRKLQAQADKENSEDNDELYRIKQGQKTIRKAKKDLQV